MPEAPVKINIKGGEKLTIKQKGLKNAQPKQSFLNRIFNIFGSRVSHTGDQVNLNLPKYSKNRKDITGFEPMPAHLKKMWDYWLMQCHDTKDSFKNIHDVYKDMDYMYYNSTIYSRSVELYADEVLQQDSQENIISVYAKDEKIEREIINLFNVLKIPSMLRETARSLVHKGNAIWLLNTKVGEGVVDVTPQEIESLADRIEFSPIDIDSVIFKNQAMVNLVANNYRLKNMIHIIESMEDYSSIFKKYLLGFQINNYVMPAWNVLHFRNKALDSAFSPYGMPLMLNCVAPFRMYDASLTMQAIAQAATFPIEKYKITMPNTMNPTEMLEAVLEFAQEYENSGLAESRVAKQDVSVATRVYTIKDIWDFELVAAKPNIIDKDSVELHKDNLIIGTGIPRNFYDPNNGSFGNSGIALMQQYKPFGRQVFMQQRALLEELTLLVKIHFVFKGIDLNNEFELSMPFPQSEEPDAATNSKKAGLDFANSVLDALKSNVLGDTQAKLPPDIIKRVYKQLLAFEPEEIDRWVNFIIAQQKETEANAQSQGGGTSTGGSASTGGTETGGEGAESFNSGSPAGTETSTGGETLQASVKRNDMYRKLLNERVIRMYEYDQRKKNNYSEGLKEKRHYLHSYAVKHSFDIDSIALSEDKHYDTIQKLQEMTVDTIKEKFSEKYDRFKNNNTNNKENEKNNILKESRKPHFK